MFPVPPPAAGNVREEEGLLPGGVAVETVVQDFLATRESLQTRRVYGTVVREFFRQAGITMLADLRPEVRPVPDVAGLVRKYLDSMTKRAETEPWRVLNPATVNARAAALRGFFRWLKEAYGYPVNPVDSTHTPLKTARTSGTESLTRKEVTALLGMLEKEAGTAARKLRDYLIVALVFGLALRRSEAAGLAWEDVDFGRRVLRVRRGGGGVKQELPLPAKLAGYLAEHAKAGGGGRYVFRALQAGRGSKAGEERPLTALRVFQVVRDSVARALPGKRVTPQGLRKTFIELALKEGESPDAIINATGHAGPEMLRYYGGGKRLRENAIHRVAEKYL
jgi:integrase